MLYLELMCVFLLREIKLLKQVVFFMLKQLVGLLCLFERLIKLFDIVYLQLDLILEQEVFFGTCTVIRQHNRFHCSFDQFTELLLVFLLRFAVSLNIILLLRWPNELDLIVFSLLRVMSLFFYFFESCLRLHLLFLLPYRVLLQLIVVSVVEHLQVRKG